MNKDYWYLVDICSFRHNLFVTLEKAIFEVNYKYKIRQINMDSDKNAKWILLVFNQIISYNIIDSKYVDVIDNEFITLITDLKKDNYWTEIVNRICTNKDEFSTSQYKNITTLHGNIIVIFSGDLFVYELNNKQKLTLEEYDNFDRLSWKQLNLNDLFLNTI